MSNAKMSVEVLIQLMIQFCLPRSNQKKQVRERQFLEKTSKLSIITI